MKKQHSCRTYWTRRVCWAGPAGVSGGSCGSSPIHSRCVSHAGPRAISHQKSTYEPIMATIMSDVTTSTGGRRRRGSGASATSVAGGAGGR